ncbi:hypothetical protein ACR30L_04065 [Psychromonas sp. PT13]|uniref:hypothetical protein n=1 Tax=Psychromonas sp. PT13 TaxID=3439547 RepID=UPI003EBA1F9E
MERLRNWSKLLLIILITILVSACSNIYWGVIKNNTNEIIKVKLTLINEHGTQILELLPIKPNDSSIWEYEQSSFVITKIDNDLSKVEATNKDGCTIIFNREAIDNNVEQHKQQIVIEAQDFIDACSNK